MLPFVVRIHRWYASPTQWTFVAGLVLNIGPIVLQSLGLLHLTDAQMFTGQIGVNAALYAAGAYLHYQSTTVIGSKADVEAAAGGGK